MSDQGKTQAKEFMKDLAMRTTAALEVSDAYPVASGLGEHQGWTRWEYEDGSAIIVEEGSVRLVESPDDLMRGQGYG